MSPGQGRDGPRPPRARRPSPFAARLTAARLALGWTQARVAAELGVDVKTAQRWEAGSLPRGLYRRAVVAFLNRHAPSSTTDDAPTP